MYLQPLRWSILFGSAVGLLKQIRLGISFPEAANLQCLHMCAYVQKHTDFGLEVASLGYQSEVSLLCYKSGLLHNSSQAGPTAGLRREQADTCNRMMHRLRDTLLVLLTNNICNTQA
jgi:hypothetical protein